MNKLQTLLFSVIISLAVAGIVFAFTNPSGNPPIGGGTIGVGSNAPANSLYIKSDGNVGIGMTGPVYKLDVNGSFNATSLYISGVQKNTVWDAKESGIATGTTAQYWRGDKTWQTLTGTLPSGTSGQTLRHDGTNWVANSILSNDGTKITINGTVDNLLTLSRSGAASSTVFKLGTDSALIVNSGGSDVLTLKGGNVGIGTTGPSTKLHVAGGARITGLVSCNTIDTDASGNLVCGTDETGGGACPTGFTDTGYGYCIQTNENSAKTWPSASDYCADTYNARLCTSSEFYNACINNKASNMTNNWEWVDDWFYLESTTAYLAFVWGNSACASISNYNPYTIVNAFRCCR